MSRNPYYKEKVRTMANMSKVRLTIAKTTDAGNNWVITVKYTARFSQQEWSTSNYNFRDSFQLWEEDGGLDGDDAITGSVSGSTFNPPAAAVYRTLTANVSGDALNNEWFGDERFYVVVRLQNTDLNIKYTAKSGILILAV